ncbi:TraV family lipoprotein [Thiocystis violacea]|uniref:TraV family lipoprotein n=1 Tax=Thiocystis violacea TaxID=13725 RepID=UPI001908D125|nr:TraV family lipoprotein [Thiocystis violacea]MBK1717301.1 hypothetical protein [Thiocystis violacea]
MSPRSSSARAPVLAITALLLATAGLTAGCGSMAVGERHFGCQGHPSDPLCLPTSRVYERTNGAEAIQPTEVDAARQTGAAPRVRDASDEPLFGYGTPRPSAPASRPREPAVTPRIADDTHISTLGETEDLLLPRSRDPIPLRMPAQVMRIWFAPWEDRQSDLHASGYVFTEITPKTWTLAAGPDRFSQAWLKPLQMEPRARASDSPSAPAASPPNNAHRRP